MKTRRILIVIPSLTLGGTEKECLYYAKTIKHLGIGNPLVVGIGKSGHLVEVLENLGIEHLTISTKHFGKLNILQKLLEVTRFAVKLRQTNPEKIISMTYWPNLLCALAWRVTGAKQFFWVQFSVDSSLPVSRLEKLAAKLKPHYLANGIAPLHHIVERHGITRSDVRIIRNYLENRPDSLDFVDKANIRDSVHFIMVANFFPEKDHDTVLRAFKFFVEDATTPKAHLHFVGSAPGISPQEDTCKALAFDLKLCGHVTFHGKVTDVKPLLQKCHIGILSTRSEGVSNAILEYMLYGLPVIATDILANRDALGKEDYPWLFPVSDETKLFELMKGLSMRSDLEKIASENYRCVVKRHNKGRFEEELRDALCKPEALSE